MLRYIYIFVLSFFFLTVNFTNADNIADKKDKNDQIISQLRSELAAQGVNPPPDPPRELGVHIACIKHGLACPDSYVEFLQTQTKNTNNKSHKEFLQKDEKKAKGKGDYDNSERKKWDVVNKRESGGGGKKSMKSVHHEQKTRRQTPHNDDEFANEAQLENLRRLRNVLRDRLNKQLSDENQWQCEETVWLRRGLNFAIFLNNLIVKSCWNFVMYSLLPCSLLVFVTVWIFFGDRIPYQHLRGLFSSDPAFVLNDVILRQNPKFSVAELVMEREGYNIANNNDAEDNLFLRLLHNFTRSQDSRETNTTYRRDRWAVTRLVLLDTHEEYRTIAVVYKLRLVLAAMVSFVLLWTLVSLTLGAAELQKSRGSFVFLRFIISSFCPAWMTTSFALYFGWSWIGGMIAYAVWEVVSAGEALVHSDAKAAALHEKILRCWYDY